MSTIDKVIRRWSLQTQLRDWGYEARTVLYRATCELLVADTTDYFGDKSVVMIGDSATCDCNGPRAVGIRGFLLNRAGGKDFINLADFSSAILSGGEQAGG